MSNKKLERLVSLSFAITLIFSMIIKGKIGVIGFTVFFFITCILGWIYQKRTEPERRMDLIERIFVIGSIAPGLILFYLLEFKAMSNRIIIFMIIFGIWLFGGLIILAIRAKRKRRGY